jgi:rRNA processing protein Gar1
MSREVGTVRAVTPSGRLTVRSPGSEVVPEGTRVTDRTRVVRGTIVRVFGPVARPYYSVRLPRPPTPAEGMALLETTLIRE